MRRRNNRPEIRHRTDSAGDRAGPVARRTPVPIAINIPSGTGGGVVKGIDFISYQNQMLSTIKNNWVWVGQRANLRVTVHFNIKENGEIVGLKLVQPSGNPSYDDSVLRAVRKSSPLPAPPEGVRKDFSDVELAFRPEDLGA